MEEGPTTLGVYHSGLVILAYVRKQTDQAIGSIPWPLHRLLPIGSCLVWVPVLTSVGNEQWCGSQINPFFPEFLLVTLFHLSNSKPWLNSFPRVDWWGILCYLRHARLTIILALNHYQHFSLFSQFILTNIFILCRSSILLEK